MRKIIACTHLIVVLLMLSACGHFAGDMTSMTTQETIGSAGELNLPFSEEPVTLSIFGTFAANNTAIDSYNDNTVYRELGKRTGVYVDWQHPALEQEEESLQLMISSGKMTDIVILPPHYEYPGGWDQAVEDGVFLDITSLVPQYMPNYSALLEKYEELSKVIRTDSGRIVGLGRFPVNGEIQGPYAGLQIRKDWLDECGLPVPETYDDWTRMLRAFKARYNCSGALSLNANGYFQGDNMNAGFGVRHTWTLDGDTIFFGPIQEGWREYVTLMNSWYEQGLIDPEYIVQANDWEPITDLKLGKTGAYASMYTLPAVYRAAIPGYECIAVSNPVKTRGQTTKCRIGSSTYQRPLIFFSASIEEEKIPLALQWLDYQYSEAGMILMNYGVYGDTWEFDAEGNRCYTEKIMNNPDGKSYAAVTEEYLGTSTFNWLQDWRKELLALPEEDSAMMEVWAKDTMEMYVPYLQYTQEESMILSPIMEEVNAYVKDMTNRMIIGEVPLSAFDEYVQEIEAMGIDKATVIVQEAYRRYRER